MAGRGRTFIPSRRKRTPRPRPRPFWMYQPVVRGPNSTTSEDNLIKSPRSLTEFLNGSDYELPTQFHWVTIDVDIDTSFSRLDGFISRHFLYESDDIGVLHFSYTRDMLRWLLRAPGSISSLQIAIRDNSTKKLAGFIAGTPATIRIKKAILRVVIVNILCVHKTRRFDGLASALMTELARRATVNEIWQGVFATQEFIPPALCSGYVLQRLLNPKKLLKLGYLHEMGMKRKRSNVEIQNLPPEPITRGFRQMKRQDVNAVVLLLRWYLQRFTVAPVVDEKFVEYFLVPKEGVVDSYVVEDPETHAISDFCSFVIQKKEIRKKRGWRVVRCAFLFYYAALKTRLLNLIKDLVVIARRDGFDLFRAHGIMGNDLLLGKLRFEVAARNKIFHYHFYNYGLVNMVTPKEFGLVVL